MTDAEIMAKRLATCFEDWGSFEEADATVLIELVGAVNRTLGTSFKVETEGSVCFIGQ